MAQELKYHSACLVTLYNRERSYLCAQTLQVKNRNRKKDVQLPFLKADIKSQIKHGATKSDLAIAQLLQYSCFAKYKEDASTHRDSKDRETLFAVYVGLSVFAKNRKRHLVVVSGYRANLLRAKLRYMTYRLLR